MDVRAIITAAARRYGVSPEALLRIAQLESGLRPDAKNPTSTASGLFQFIDSTWSSYGRGASPFDPHANADAGARLARDVSASLRRALGRDPEGWEIYMGHQQGPGGAAAILRASPQTRVVDALSRVYRSPAAARRAVAGNIPARSGLHPDTVTVGDWLNLWRSKFNRTPVPRGSQQQMASRDISADASAEARALAEQQMLAEARALAEQQMLAEAQNRAATEALRRLAGEDTSDRVCPPGFYFDPVTESCVPMQVSSDQGNRAQTEAREEAKQRVADPLSRFDVILDALPGQVARLR